MTGLRRPGRDDGVTLLELTVAMSLMSIFTAIFTTGIGQLYRSVRGNEAMSTAQAQITVAFQRLDAEIRYAAGISAEGQDGPDWYVEFLSTYSGTPECTQLRYTSAGQFQQRSWDQGTTPPSFTVLASGASATHPFTRYPVVAGSSVDFQRLAVSLTATGGSAARSRAISIMFTALNTSPNTDSDTVCTEGRP